MNAESILDIKEEILKNKTKQNPKARPVSSLMRLSLRGTANSPVRPLCRERDPNLVITSPQNRKQTITMTKKTVTKSQPSF